MWLGDIVTIKRNYLLDRKRQFRSTKVPIQVWNDSILCLERIGVTLSKKEILKYEGSGTDDFEDIIEGSRPSSKGQVYVRVKVHGWRDMNHHGGFWPTSLTTDLITETYELSENNEKLTDTPDANALSEEFNFNIGRYYLWGTSG